MQGKVHTHHTTVFVATDSDADMKTSRCCHQSHKLSTSS